MSLYIGGALIAGGVPGKDGKSAFQHAQYGGYTGTESEFNAMLGQPPQKFDLIATEGQGTFTIPFDFNKTSSNLTIYYNGILMQETTNYTVNTANGNFTLVGFTAHANDILTIMGVRGGQDIDYNQKGLEVLNNITQTSNTAQSNINSLAQEVKEDIQTLIEGFESQIPDASLIALKNEVLPLAGGTMQGVLAAQNNSNYSTAQVRNIIISTEEPSNGNVGDIWIRYTP